MTFDPGQSRDEDGRWTDGAPGLPGSRDKLKLAGRIALDPGEALVSSGQVGGGEYSTSDTLMAVVGTGAGLKLRLGLVPHDERSGWDGRSGDTVTLDEAGIGALWDVVGELDGEIARRRAERKATERAYRERVSAANAAAQDAFQRGKPAAEEFQRLRAEARRVAQDEYPDEEYYGDVRAIPAAGGAGLHYRVVGSFDLDAGSQRWEVQATVESPGAGPAWSFDDAVDDERHTTWEPKHLREMARALDRLTSGEADRASAWPRWRGGPTDMDQALRESLVEEFDVDEESLREAAEVIATWDDEEDAEETVEAFDPSAHPRAAAGSAAGGQFAAAGSGGAAAEKAAPAKAVRKGGEALGFDAKSGRGTGYGKKGGDARVRKLQAALNRLGLTDASGRKLVVDGKLGPKTTAAIKAAQRKLGVPADGKVTPQLLARMVAAKSLSKPAKKAASKKAMPKKAMPKPRSGTTTTTRTDSGGRTVTMTRRSEADVDQPEGTQEIADRIAGRVLEAAGTTEDGGRVFRVRIIAAGDSKNGRRYPASVLREAVGLYEGAKAYDHHRSAEELRSSTIHGLVGWYRNVEATDVGLDADLCLLPGAAHTAEALDATVAAQAAGLPPLVGISHDAMTYTRPITVGRRRMQEAVAIAKVNSADVVADPAAGGMATRVLAGGIEEEETDPEGIEPDGESNEEDDVTVTSDAVLAALQTATPEQLAAVGLSKAAAPAETTEETVVEPTTTTEAVAGVDKASFLGKLMIREAVTGAGLPERLAESLRDTLPDRITESDVDAQIAALKSVMGAAERAGLAPTATAQVTQEALDKKKDALDRFFAGDYSGYRSFRQAYLDVTGNRTAAWDENLNKRIMRESIGGHFDSGDRTTESLTASSWDVILGDSITRRMVAMYTQPSLQNWRQIVSSVVPVNDFRTQRIDRLGGYGTLPAVNQGEPYQPLTSPGDEEVTYAVTKRGGTEDLTLEMIANDDVRAIGNIPKRLGLAAARTLHNFVWDFLKTNPTLYDSVALFAAGHSNTTAAALSQSNVSVLRALMRDQAGYGDTANILSMVPKFLVVPNELEELAFQIVSSAVAIPATPAGAADTPNLHQGMTHIVVDYLTDANDWFLVADPSMCPTIEVGFYQGRQEPELFTQSDQTVGSMFNADKLTYKIRHIYSGAVLDYRGFQRGTQ